MKLIEVQVRNFRNILDAGEVAIQPDVTCLVGKNESGKTAFLQALHRLNPAQGNVSLSIPDQYPAWLEKQHRRKMDLNIFCPVTAKFKVEDSDKAALEERFGKGVLKSDILTLSRQYNGKLTFDYTADEEVAIATILKQVPRLKSFTPTLKASKRS
jgi:predicted ATP-dependent endonuclease of OLD family